MKKRILLVGAYGIRNAGDDAPLEFLVQGLRERQPEVEFRFDVLARHTDPLLEDRLGLRFYRNLEYTSCAAARGRKFRGFNTGDGSHALRLAQELIRRADLVVAGAGNVLTDLSIDVLRGPVPLLSTYAFLADLQRVPMMLFGIGAGPLESQHGRELAAWILRRAAWVTCREEPSRRLLHDLAPEVEVERLPDPVLGIPRASDDELCALWQQEGLSPVGERPRLAVSVRDLRNGGAHRARLAAALRELSADYELLFVPQCCGVDCDDREEARLLAKELPPGSARQLNSRHPPAVLRRVYEEVEATLAMRLHATVFSTMAGTPTTAIAYLPKVRSFMEEVGLDSQLLSLESEPREIVARVRESVRSGATRESQDRLQRATAGTDSYLSGVERLLDLWPGTQGIAHARVTTAGRR